MKFTRECIYHIVCMHDTVWPAQFVLHSGHVSFLTVRCLHHHRDFLEKIIYSLVDIPADPGVFTNTWDVIPFIGPDSTALLHAVERNLYIEFQFHFLLMRLHDKAAMPVN